MSLAQELIQSGIFFTSRGSEITIEKLGVKATQLTDQVELTLQPNRTQVMSTKTALAAIQSRWLRFTKSHPTVRKLLYEEWTGVYCPLDKFT